MASETKEADFVRSEWMYGSFKRDVVLPEGIDMNKISAEYRDGMLEITAPISAEALPRHVEIKNTQEAISARR